MLLSHTGLHSCYKTDFSTAQINLWSVFEETNEMFGLMTLAIRSPVAQLVRH